MPRVPRLLPSVLAAVFAAGLSAPPAAAQDAPLEAAGMETVDVEIVNVEVYVTDGDGRTVDDLRAEDFRLFVDQAPTDIVNFYRAGGARQAESLGTEEREAAPTATVVGGQATPRPTGPRPAESATLVIYVDHLQLSLGGRRSYLRQVRDFLDGRLTGDDQVMIVSNTGSLALEQRFTGDFSEIESVLDGMWQAPAGALETKLKWRHAIDQIESLILSTPQGVDPCRFKGSLMLNVAVEYGEWVQFQVERSLEGLQRLVHVLAGFEGRKSVLYLSNGLHQTPGGDLLLKMRDICSVPAVDVAGGEMATSITDRTFRLTRLANSVDVTLHTLDATGLEGNSSAGVGGSQTFEHSGRTYDLRETPAVDRLRRQSRQGTLFTLAQETGGMAILNANDIRRDLEKVDDSMRRFYSLGFRPPAGGAEGESHLLRVELEPPRKGHRLHYRRTYEAREPADRTVGQLMSALLLGLEENPLGVDIQVGKPQVGDTGLATVALRIALPFGALGWLEHGDHRTGEVELFIAVQDGEGNEIDMRRKTIPFRIKESLWSEARAKTHTLEIGLPVPSANARLAFAVADRVGERVSYLTSHEATSTVSSGPQASPGC